MYCAKINKYVKEVEMLALCAVKEAVRAIYKFETELRKKFDFSINEALILCLISCEPKPSKDLSKELNISLSRISRVFSSLETKELVKREIGDDDKRKMVFKITDLGKERLKRMTETELEIPEISWLKEQDVPEISCWQGKIDVSDSVKESLNKIS